MWAPEVVRTTAFRWAAVIAASFAGLSLTLFAFVYWQTAGYEQRALDAAVRQERAAIAAAPASERAQRLGAWIADDHHSVRYGLLLAADGRKLAGNMDARPASGADGVLRTLVTHGLDGDDDERREVLRGASTPMPDGAVLTLGLDTDELDHMRGVIGRALVLGLLPMVTLALGGGALLGRRALLRVAAVDRAVARVMRGQMDERLPLRGNGDEFDQLASGVNGMLDELERLLEEVRGAGDSVAHDLRTPLTRLRTRLETARTVVGTRAAFQDAIDEALAWLDGSLAVITAVLRIGEIEHGRRRAGFRAFDLVPLLREAFDLFEPLADEKGVAFALHVQPPAARILGDRDLMLEALANLIENAVKFTPRGGRCDLTAATGRGHVVVGVNDNGPGIPTGERDAVLKRFYRGERSRSTNGSGLGLSLVAAVMRLHGFTLSIADNAPGCRFEVRAPLQGRHEPAPAGLGPGAGDPASAWTPGTRDGDLVATHRT